MIIIINVSNLYIGGGTQVAISFLNELRYLKKNNQYHVFLSKLIHQQIETNVFAENFKFYLIQRSAASFKTRFFIIKKLNQLEARISPDIVFTLFGPSFWRPKTKHLMGFADPWILNKDSIVYKEISFFQRIKKRLLNFYKIYYLKKDADYYVIETIDGKNKLLDLLKILEDKVFVVSNCYSHVFGNKEYLKENNRAYVKLPEKKENEFRLVLISNNYPHKNLRIIRNVIPLITSYNIKFVLTIDNKSFSNLFRGLENFVLNIGPVHLNSCPSIYSQCDGLFLPTLLEVFSASYPEAMKMKKPILTSNYSFAVDVCQDAALYFDPLDPQDIANSIKKIFQNKNLKNTLVYNGKKRLKNFETAKSRAKKYIKICTSLSKKNQKLC